MPETPESDALPRRRSKSAEAFRTISEVAKDLDLPQHVLRFWETKFPSIRPLKRGGGRRYYRPEDVALLRRIRDLLHNDGYTIKGVQKLLRQNGAKILQNEPGPAEPTMPDGKAGSLRRSELEGLLNELVELHDLLSRAGR